MNAGGHASSYASGRGVSGLEPDVNAACRDGILLLDKPLGLSSNAALQRAKRLLGSGKGGHTGSLDPLATGLLPLCFGEATKFSQFLLDADKVYHAVFRLGVETNTGDAEGEVTGRRAVTVGEPDIRSAMRRFCGEIEQVPPIFSALKHQGRPLYEIARRGGTVTPPSRQVRIHRFSFVALREDSLEVEIACSKGTYVRSLAVDLGNALGCGAHVGALRRLAAGPFRVEDALSLDALLRADPADVPLMPADMALSHLPRLQLWTDEAARIACGQSVVPERAPPPGVLRLYDEEERFMGVGMVDEEGRLVPRRLLSTNKRL